MAAAIGCSAAEPREAPPLENTIAPFRMAQSQLANASWLANIALNAHPDADFRAHARAWSARVAERVAALGSDQYGPACRRPSRRRRPRSCYRAR